jgi:hypothetical protein
MILRAIPRRYTARTVARDLRFRAIGVQQAYAQICIDGRQNPLHSVGTNAVMPIADAAGECVNVGGRVGEIQDQKIVAASGRFDERDAGHVGALREF